MASRCCVLGALGVYVPYNILGFHAYFGKLLPVFTSSTEDLICQGDRGIFCPTSSASKKTFVFIFYPPLRNQIASEVQIHLHKKGSLESISFCKPLIKLWGKLKLHREICCFTWSSSEKCMWIMDATNSTCPNGGHGMRITLSLKFYFSRKTKTCTAHDQDVKRQGQRRKKSHSK